MPKRKPQKKEDPRAVVIYAGRWWARDTFKITVGDLQNAIATYSHNANQSAFARDVMGCDSRYVRRWLAGGGMQERYAQILKSHIDAKKAIAKK